MDKWWNPNLDEQGGVDVLRKCVDEVEKRELRCLVDVTNHSMVAHGIQV